MTCLPSSQPKWYYGKGFILLMLFLVLGPVGLPLLWRSPRFTPFWKVGLTTLVILYTAVLIQAAWMSYRGLLDRLTLFL